MFHSLRERALTLRPVRQAIAVALAWLVVCGAAAVGQIVPLPQSYMPAETSDGTPRYVAQRNGEQFIDADEYLMEQRTCSNPQAWSWHLLPDTLIYPAYLAGVKESRFGGIHFLREEQGLLEEGILGAHVGIWRYGTTGDVRPEGWQWDVEGASFPRLDPGEEFDLESVDFRIGTFISYGEGPIQQKFGYYHLSSHIGDEFLLKNPTFDRLNFKRETLVYGISYFPWENLRLYAEVGWAFDTDGGSEPWEFQFGIDYSPHENTGFRGALFWALNGYLRQEVGFGGDFVAQIGWAWRDRPYGHLFRIGIQYLNGPSPQFELYQQFDQQIGLGIWYDF